MGVVRWNIGVDFVAVELIGGPASGNAAIDGKHEGGETNVVLVVGGVASCDQADSKISLLGFVGWGSIDFVERLITFIGKRAMEKRKMGRIALALQTLKVAALHQTFGYIGLFKRHLSPLIGGKQRHFRARSEIGIDHAAGFVGRIGSVMKFFSEIAVPRFRPRFEDVSIDIILPAVVNAAQPTLFVAAEIQRRPAMGATLGKQANATLAVPKSNQLLTQQSNAHRRAVRRGNFLGQKRRNPIASYEFAHWGSRFDSGQEFVFF